MVGSQPGHAGPVGGQGGQLPRQLGGNSGENEYVKVRSVVHNRPQSPPVNSRYRPPTRRSNINSDGGESRPSAGRATPDRVVIGDLAQLTTSNLEHSEPPPTGEAPARPPENSITVSIVPTWRRSRLCRRDSERPGKCEHPRAPAGPGCISGRAAAAEVGQHRHLSA